MQAPQTQKPPVPAVLFDASLDGDVDQVLAMAMLFGLESRRRDGLHPTLKGYQMWADGLAPLLTELLGPRAATDTAPAPTGDPSAPCVSP